MVGPLNQTQGLTNATRQQLAEAITATENYTYPGFTVTYVLVKDTPTFVISNPVCRSPILFLLESSCSIWPPPYLRCLRLRLEDGRDFVER